MIPFAKDVIYWSIFIINGILTNQSYTFRKNTKRLRLDLECTL